MKFKFRVMCPKCKRKQWYIPQNPQMTPFGGINLSNKFKICVNCGHKFRVYKNFRENNLVKDLKSDDYR